MVEKTVNGHVLLTTADCDCDKKSDAECPVCDWGLGVCKLCNAAEIELEQPCPGKRQICRRCGAGLDFRPSDILYAVCGSCQKIEDMQAYTAGS